MARAPFQVIVIPYRIVTGGHLQYLLFRRADLDAWQWIAGGGEDDETAEKAARREAFEETHISHTAVLIRLDSTASIPVTHFSDRHLWSENPYVIPEYSFGVEIADDEIYLSKEHSECLWADYETAQNLLQWDSNKTALWELDNRIRAKLADTG